MLAPTLCIHGGERHATDVALPLTVSATYRGSGDKVYWRAHGSHDVRERVEAVMTGLDRAAGSAMFSSGQAAAHAVLSLLSPRRVYVGVGYHGTKQLLDLLGAERAADPTDLQAGDVCWVETPNNPYCEVFDIAATKRALRPGVTLCVDATFAPPPLQMPLKLGADVAVYSSTKFLNGHSDSVGGIVSTADTELLQRIYNFRMVAGSTPGSLDAWLLHRSLKTLPLRLQHQSSTASRIAAWLQGQPYVTKVWHPSLPGHPGHAVARREMSGFGGVLAFEVDPVLAEALPQRLRVITAATSLGSVESLIEWRHRWDASIPKSLLRLSVGLESFEDLCADISSAVEGDGAGDKARL